MEGKTKSLMEMLLDAGYPQSEMHHHCSDLYIFATPLTSKVVREWCKANDYRKDVFVDVFIDEITGKPMYDIAFQYDPYWEEKARKAK